MWIDLFATSPTHSVCLHLKSVYKWAGDWSCGSSLSFCILLTSLLLFADGIVGFLKKQAGPASVVLKDNADLEKFLADQDASVVGKHLVKETFLKVFLKLFTSNILHNLKFRVFYVTHFLFRHYCRFLLLILNPGLTDHSFPGFFADDKSQEQVEFLRAASALRDNYRFAHTNSEALLKSHDIEGEWVDLFRRLSPNHLKITLLHIWSHLCICC